MLDLAVSPKRDDLPSDVLGTTRSEFDHHHRNHVACWPLRRAKEALYKDVRGRLAEIGFDPANSIVFLTENKPIDWSFSEAGSVKSVLGL